MEEHSRHEHAWQCGAQQAQEDAQVGGRAGGPLQREQRVRGIKAVERELMEHGMEDRGLDCW